MTKSILAGSEDGNALSLEHDRRRADGVVVLTAGLLGAHTPLSVDGTVYAINTPAAPSANSWTRATRSSIVVTAYSNEGGTNRGADQGPCRATAVTPL